WATNQVSDLIANGVQGIHFYTLNQSKATLKIYEDADCHERLAETYRKLAELTGAKEETPSKTYRELAKEHTNAKEETSSSLKEYNR
ncbi:MAG: methylenetetrahydrofolate reductase, partial [Syntrophobacterales bacterium]|nr:methylenetetrahydrofolate reductase [Syntrophobacterales bacterium]